MWTYNSPPKTPLSSKKRLEYFARIELFHSLHNRNTVAFVGSGVTLPYGRCSWKELCLILINKVDELYINTLKPFEEDGKPKPTFERIEAMHLHNSLCNILQKSSEKGDDGIPLQPLALSIDIKFPANVHVLELCAQLCTALGQPEKLKEETANLFHGDADSIFKARLRV